MHVVLVRLRGRLLSIMGANLTSSQPVLVQLPFLGSPRLSSFPEVPGGAAGFRDVLYRLET